MSRSDTAIEQCWITWVQQASLHRREGSGRPRATTARKDRAIILAAVTSPDTSQTTIRRLTGTPMTTQRIHRRLRERNIRSRRPLRRLPLDPTHRRQRLQWCRERAAWTE
ncbi:hypothetical protein JGG47_23530 [Salmonella enterica subsp. enterica serovar Derby]|nr:hypothetical protein [Salmonella enterica subsp. enterica serovar Derby]